MNAVLSRHPRAGERAPEFLLPSVDGVPGTFYDCFCGRPAVLLLGADAQSLAPFAPLGARAGVLGLVPGRGGESVDAPIRAMGDDGRIARALGESYPCRSVVAWVLDETLRLVSRLPAASVQAVAASLDALPLCMDSPSVVEATAPVLMLPDVVSPELCEALIRCHGYDHFDSGMVRMVDGKPALVPDYGAKRRLDHRLVEDALTTRLTEVLSRRVLPGIAAAFNYRVTRFEPFKVVCYESSTGGYFRRHRDNVTPDARHRRLALSINLNDGYQGGAWYSRNSAVRATVRSRGGAIVFSGGLLHEATDVTAGHRCVLLSFLWGDEASRA